MDKIIKGILGNIAPEMLLQQGSGFFALAGGYRSNQRIQFCTTQGKQPLGDRSIIFLCVFLFLILGDIIHEANNDFSRFYIIFKGLDAGVVFLILGKEHECTLAILALLVVVLLGGCIYQTEMNCDTIENKGVVLEILAGLDVVLILIGPVQFYFFTFIGNGVYAFLVATLGNKVTVLIVTIEERIQRRIHISLQCSKVCAFSQLLLKLNVLLLHRCGVGQRIHSHTHCGSVFFNLCHLRMNFFLTALHERCKCYLHHLRQTLRQKILNLRFSEIHHTINSKVEIGFIKLENLFQ